MSLLLHRLLLLLALFAFLPTHLPLVSAAGKGKGRQFGISPPPPAPPPEDILKRFLGVFLIHANTFGGIPKAGQPCVSNSTANALVSAMVTRLSGKKMSAASTLVSADRIFQVVSTYGRHGGKDWSGKELTRLNKQLDVVKFRFCSLEKKLVCVKNPEDPGTTTENPGSARRGGYYPGDGENPENPEDPRLEEERRRREEAAVEVFDLMTVEKEDGKCMPCSKVKHMSAELKQLCKEATEYSGKSE